MSILNILEENDVDLENFNRVELVEYFQNSLISKATGGGFSNKEYKFIRNKLLKDDAIQIYLPKFVKTCRDIDSFWSFIKSKFDNYEERRQFLRKEFLELLDFLELNDNSFLEENIFFDENHINSEWKKALERKYKDPEGAITIARTLIETTLKYILDEKEIEYNENSDLSELYKKVSKTLNLSPEQHQIKTFKQILGGANGIISGLGALRNKLGDAHGKRKTHIKPRERHSELAVNLSGAMALFLYKTYKDL